MCPRLWVGLPSSPGSSLVKTAGPQQEAQGLGSCLPGDRMEGLPQGLPHSPEHPGPSDSQPGPPRLPASQQCLDWLGLGPHPAGNPREAASHSCQGQLQGGRPEGGLEEGPGRVGADKARTEEAHEVHPMCVVGPGRLLEPSSCAGGVGGLPSASGSEMWPGVPGHPQGRGCWAHRRSLGPRDLLGAGAVRRQSRAGLSILLEERRPCSVMDSPQLWSELELR